MGSELSHVIRLLDYDEGQATEMISEFIMKMLPGKTYGKTCINQSGNKENARCVFLLRVRGNGDFALKFDPESGRSGRLEREANWLKTLGGHFAGYENLSVPELFYLSEDRSFIVTRFADGESANNLLLQKKDPSDTYKFAARWLSALHKYSDGTQQKFMSDWIFDAIDNLTITQTPAARRRTYLPWISRLYDEAEELNGRPQLKCISHGRFYPRNLLVSRSSATGMDLSTIEEKLGLYDVVDFMSNDPYRQISDADISKSGVSKQAVETFFEHYSPTFDPQVFAFMMRARLLIDFLKITPQDYSKHKNKRTQSALLERRLEIAFGN